MRSSEKGRFSVKDDVRTVRQVEERFSLQEPEGSAAQPEAAGNLGEMESKPNP